MIWHKEKRPFVANLHASAISLIGIYCLLQHKLVHLRFPLAFDEQMVPMVYYILFTTFSAFLSGVQQCQLQNLLLHVD